MFPEAAEVRLPLRADAEKEKENCKAKDTENHNCTQQPPPELGFLPPSHLNGSVKLTVSEVVETEENANKTEQQTLPVIIAASSEKDEPYNLWKFPRKSGKFTQVREISPKIVSRPQQEIFRLQAIFFLLHKENCLTLRGLQRERGPMRLFISIQRANSI